MNEILQQRIVEAAHEFDKEGLRVIFENGANFILNNLWISVEEALSDDDENVLLTFNDGHIIVAYHSGNYWWWCDGFVCGTKTNGQPMYSSSQMIELDDKPIYWMPIPELKGGKE